MSTFHPKYSIICKTTKYDYTWKVDIWDTDYSGGTTIELNSQTPPLLSYESQSDKRYSAIKGSSLSVPLLVENSGVENWLFNDVEQAKEERFYAHLYVDKGSGYDLYWVGVLLHDLNQREDAYYPYEYQLKFTDGLARLKNFKFTEIADRTNSLSYTAQTLNWFLYQVLKMTPFYARVSPAYILYSNSVNFYEYNMRSGGTHWYTNVDPLDETTIYPKAFCKTLDDGQLEAFTFYDILEQILTLFNARILLSNGYFRIISVNNYANSTWKERTYLADGTFDAQTAVAWDTTVNQVDSIASSGTNCWQYFPSAKTVSRKYLTNNNNLIWEGINIFAGTASHIGDIIGDRIMQFTASFRLEQIIPPAGTLAQSDYFGIKIKIQVGSYYLNTNLTTNTNSWTTTSTDRYYLEIPISSNTMLFGMNILTPLTPVGNHVDVSIHITDITWNRVATSSVLTDSSGSNIGYWSDGVRDERFWLINNSASFRYYNGSNDDTYIKYVATSASGIINSEDIELLDGVMGDGTGGNNGVLYTGDKYAPLLTTVQWKRDGTGDAMDINNLLVVETIAAQLVPNPRYQGNLITNGNPENRYSYAGVYYILNGGEWDLETMEWQGEWFKVYRSDEGVVDSPIPSDTTGGGNLMATAQDGIRNNQKSIGYYVQERLVGAVTDTVSGTVTSIDCDVLKDMKAGDKIEIIPINSSIVECELSADCINGDPIINIVSQTFSDDIPAGSIMFVPLDNPIIRDERITGTATFQDVVMMTNLPTSDPHVVGQVWSNSSVLKISNG
jgi:hypothetical protein